jgi:hypothetical protein
MAPSAALRIHTGNALPPKSLYTYANIFRIDQFPCFSYKLPQFLLHSFMKNTILTLCALGAPAAAANAASIGINLGAGRAASSLAVGDVAGVVPQANGNNAVGATGSLIGLNNDSGAASSAGITWAACYIKAPL